MTRSTFLRPVLALLCLAATSSLAVHAQLIFTTQGANASDHAVDVVGLNGSGASTLYSGSPMGNPNDIAVDYLTSKLYIADGTGGQAIRVANRDGSGSVSLVYSVGITVSGIAVDAANQQIYFTTQSATATDDRVMRVNYDGSNPVTLFSGAANFNQPTGLALDLSAGKIYVSDGTGGQAIKVGNLDGSGTMSSVLSVGINVSGLALDASHQKIYFTTQSATSTDDRVMTVGYDGTGSTTLFSGASAFGNPNRLALDVVNGKIYIADGTGGHSIDVANMDGTGSVSVLYDAGLNVSGIALVPEPGSLSLMAGSLLGAFALLRRYRRESR